MNAKQLAAILLLSIAAMALLGCVEGPGPGGGTGPSGGGLAQQPGQVVGPEYHDSEDAAFDALSQELGEIPEMSTEDLEAMLGE